MAEDTLIPPPSIGASGQNKVDHAEHKSVKGLSSGTKLWLLVLACVVVGIGLGVVVYQQSVTPKTTPKPSPKVAASPVAPQVSLVTPSTNNSITFPKAGRVRVYYRALSATASWPKILADLESTTGSLSVEFPGGNVTTPMQYRDTDFTVQAQEKLNFKLYDALSRSMPMDGYMAPSANKCGANGFGIVDITSYLDYAKAQAGGEPIVGTQCWADYTPPNDKGKVEHEYDFNDYLLIWSYVPTSAATSPSPSPSVKASASPKASPSPSVKASSSPKPSPSPSIKASPSPSVKASPSPSVKASPSPSVKASPSPSVKASPSPSIKASPSPSVKASATVVASSTPTPSPSARAAAPEASELPEAGVFEVTAGTAGIAVVLTLLGLLGLLML